MSYQTVTNNIIFQQLSVTSASQHAELLKQVNKSADTHTHTHTHTDINRFASIHSEMLSCSTVQHTHTDTHGLSGSSTLSFNPLLEALSVQPDEDEQLRQNTHRTVVSRLFKGLVGDILGRQQQRNSHNID